MFNTELWELKHALRVFLALQADKFDKDTCEFRDLKRACKRTVIEKLYDYFNGSVIAVPKTKHDEFVRGIEGHGWKSFAKKRPKLKRFDDFIFFYLSGSAYHYGYVDDFRRSEKNFIYFQGWETLNKKFDESYMNCVVTVETEKYSGVKFYPKNQKEKLHGTRKYCTEETL